CYLGPHELCQQRYTVETDPEALCKPCQNVGAENGPCSSCISGLKNTLATHGKGTEIEIAGASINGVMIAGINRNTVDGCSGNQRIIGYHAPGSGITTTVGRLPYTASNRTKISHNAAIHRGGWINRNRVHSPFSRRVIKTTGTTRHLFRLRTQSGETGSAKSQRTKGIQHGRHSRRNAHGHARMLYRCCAHPGWIKAPCRIRQTIVPELFQPPQIGALGLDSATGYRHIWRRPLSVRCAWT